MTDTPEATVQGRYHHGDLRRTLLEEARALLQEVGPEAVSLREVARRAGVSSRAPYRHFDDKDALLSTLAAEGFDALRTVLQGAEAEAAAAAGHRLRRQAVAYVRFALERPAQYRLMFSYRLEDADPALAAAKSATRALLAHSVAPGGVQGADAAARATGCWALVHGLAVLIQGGLVDDAAATIENVVDAMIG